MTSNNAIPTTPPSGFRDFLPDACALRARAIETISGIYRAYGFSQIATASVEDLAVLLGKGGGENEKLIFKILKRGEKLEAALGGSELADLGLRFDLTLPLARFYSRHQSELPHPFKAFHIGPVWRAERSQKGRYREFYQCDADVIGSESLQAEIEVISAILTAFSAFGLEDAAVHINDRRILLAILEKAKVPAEKIGGTCISLDKLDKIGPQKVADELRALLGEEPAKALEPLVLGDTPSIDWLRSFAPEAMDRLNAITSLLSESFDGKRLVLQPSLVRGFDYYTSTVFEFRHPKLSGSLGGGGRYDRLTEKFGGQAVPACGASIGFERLMLLLEESPSGTQDLGPDVCVTVFSEELRAKTLAAANKLRAAGLSVDVYPGCGKFKAQFRYADSRKARLALVLGPEEAAAGRIKVKDLKTGEEKLETLENLISRLKK